MLFDEADGAKHAIDFLHPRRNAQAARPARLLAAIATLAGHRRPVRWYQQSQELKKLDGAIAALAKTRDERKSAGHALCGQVVNSLRAWHNADAVGSTSCATVRSLPSPPTWSSYRWPSPGPRGARNHLQRTGSRPEDRCPHGDRHPRPIPRHPQQAGSRTRPAGQPRLVVRDLPGGSADRRRPTWRI